MANRKDKGVTLIVDRRFFDIMEKARKKKQEMLGGKVGSGFNLTQRNFTAILAKENFKFKVSNPRPLRLKSGSVIRRRRR